MPDKTISLTELGLYGAGSILKKAGIDKVNKDAIYTFTNKSGGNTLTFLFNGQVKQGETTISVTGKDLYRLTMRAGQSSDDKGTPMVVEEKIDDIVQKEYKFTVSSAQRIFVEGNQAPEVTVKNYLTRGDHKAAAVISYTDPEGDAAQIIALDLAQNKGLKLILGGTEIDSHGDLYFTRPQWQQLIFSLPAKGYVASAIHANVTDVYGERSQTEKATLLSEIPVQEFWLYEAGFILEKVGIAEISQNTVYTFINRSQYVAGGSQTYVFNGKVRQNEDVISVRGKDFYRFTIQAAQSRAHYKNTPMVVQERIDGVLQKEYKFMVSSQSRVSLEGNQPPAVIVKSKLSPGDNKNVITCSDPEGHPQKINLDLRHRQQEGLVVVFDGIEVKGRGLFSLLDKQLKLLDFRVREKGEKGPFSDEVYVSSEDIHGGRSEPKATIFSVGQ